MRSFFPAFLFFRVVAIILYLGGMALLFLPAGELFEIKAVNWQEDFIRKNRQWKNALQTLTKLTDESYTSADDLQKRYHIELSEFIKERIKTRVIDVSGAEWQGFFTDLATAQTGSHVDPAWKKAGGWFKTDSGLPATIRSNFDEEKTFFYVQISDTQQRQEHLAVSLKKATDLAFKAPWHLAFPFRHAGCWMILGGILVYLFNSSQTPAGSHVCLDSSKTGRGSDFFTAIFAPVFIIIGAGAAVGIGSQPFSTEWFIVSSIFWSFSLLIAFAWMVTAWYKSFSIEYNDHRVVFNSLFSSSSYDMTMIREARADRHTNPWWMKKLLTIGRITARGNSTRSLYEDKEEPGFSLAINSGISSPVVRFNDLRGLTDFFNELEAHGVYVEESLKQKATALDAEDSGGSWLITGIFARFISLSFIMAASYGVISTFSVPEPQIMSQSFPEGSAFKTLAENNQPTTEELAERVRRNNELMYEVNKLSQRINELSEQAARATDPELRKKLAEESNQIMQKLMKLRNSK